MPAHVGSLGTFTACGGEGGGTAARPGAGGAPHGWVGTTAVSSPTAATRAGAMMDDGGRWAGSMRQGRGVKRSKAESFGGGEDEDKYSEGELWRMQNNSTRLRGLLANIEAVRRH
jgi:hypothetical protein